MGSETIVDYFKGQKSSYSTAFKKVQKGLSRDDSLSKGRYDAAAFQSLCAQMDKISRLKGEGVPFEKVLDGILPNTVEETFYNGSPSDYRVQPFYYLSAIVATKHIYKDSPDVTIICGEKFTQTVQQMIADGRDYHEGYGGGPLRDCRYPEETGDVLKDMQEGFGSQLGESLRAEGLDPVMDVATETIACTDSLKPYFETWRNQEESITQQQATLREQMRKLEKEALLTKQQQSDAVATELNGFNPFTADPVQ
ncbi:MAG: hypothetical protein IKI95_03590 [Clostridia bacterium]|nr:hypothetical protein [Clostridia bacterium]